MILDAYLIVNSITFWVFGYDKYLAKTNKWRISERTLLLLTVVGGSLGAVLGMLLFRHKISKPSFYVPLILIIGIQGLIVYFWGWEGLLRIVS